MPTALRVLIVEDSQNDCDLLLSTLARGGYNVTYERVCNAASLAEGLENGPWDIVISDYSMPGFKGTDALELVRKKSADIPFIFFSGTIGEDTAVNAMRAGAQDYVIKGKAARLLPAIQRELRDAELRRERAQMEQRLRSLEKFEALGKLAGGIAHDFNNVIGAIMGWAEIGVDRVRAETPEAKLFSNIREHASRAAGLTRQLLAYARRQVLEPRNIQLNRLISEMTNLLHRGIGETIEMKLLLAADLWTTRADPTQLEQVLMNLCFNARDAMPNGGQLLIETRNVELEAQYCKRHTYAQPGRYVRLSISDTGTGMAPETLNRIFEPFFTTKEIGQGTGLGLPTVMGIVKQHGGFLDVYTEVGQGTAFHAYLPSTDAAPEPLPQQDTAAARGGSETILIAEDHEGMLEMAREILEGLGYRLVVARNGEEALRQFELRKQDIAMAILDIIMPKAGGPEVYDRILKDKPNLPVLFTSGYSDHDPLLTSLTANGASVLQKPYSSKALSKRVREILDHATTSVRGIAQLSS